MLASLSLDGLSLKLSAALDIVFLQESILLWNVSTLARGTGAQNAVGLGIGAQVQPCACSKREHSTGCLLTCSPEQNKMKQSARWIYCSLITAVTSDHLHSYMLTNSRNSIPSHGGGEVSHLQEDVAVASVPGGPVTEKGCGMDGYRLKIISSLYCTFWQLVTRWWMAQPCDLCEKYVL